MNNYYKYLSVSREDERWGLNVLNTGCTHIEPADVYPFTTHPAHHNFDWNRGRVLDEYQVIYITRGQGLFESEKGRPVSVREGSVILLFPGERHRYKPSLQTGWDEYWIGLKGEIMDNLVANSFFTPGNPCLYIGFNESVFNIFSDIIEGTRQDLPGRQPRIAGAAMHLMGSFYSLSQQHAVTQSGEREDKDKNLVVNKARILFRSHAEQDYSPEQAARELQVGYSWFRKIFKNQTGLSPGQFFTRVKIERARELLADPSLSIKEIAYSLSFDSGYYFGKVFREKTGMKPTDYRKKISGNGSKR